MEKKGDEEMATVIIYTQDECVKCQAEKVWFEENSIPYEERNIRKNKKYMNEVVNLRAAATPVTIIRDNNKEEVVMGFDEERLALLLNV